jgi:hypothetical protein
MEIMHGPFRSHEEAQADASQFLQLQHAEPNGEGGMELPRLKWDQPREKL